MGNRSEEAGAKIENLELNRETVQDLSEQESQGAQGGAMQAGRGREVTETCPSVAFCHTLDDCPPVMKA